MTEALFQGQDKLRPHSSFLHDLAHGLSAKKKTTPSSPEEKASQFLCETRTGFMRFSQEESTCRATNAGDAIDVLLKSKNTLSFIPEICDFLSSLQIFSLVAENNEHTMYFSKAQEAITKNNESVVAKLEKNDGDLAPFYHEQWTQSLWNAYESPSHQPSVVQTVIPNLTRATWALSSYKTKDIFLSAFENSDKNKSFVPVAEKYIIFLSEPNLIYSETAHKISAEALAAGKKESEAIRNASKAKEETCRFENDLKKLREIGRLCAKIDRLTPHKSPSLSRISGNKTISGNSKTPHPS